MEEKDIEQIERYWRNALGAQERTSFERRMAADAGFAKEVQLYLLALEAVRMEGESQLRARLAGRGRESDRQRTAPSRRRWFWVLPFALLSALAIWRFAGAPAQAEPVPAPSPPPAAPAVPAQDSLPNAAPPKIEPEEKRRTDAGKEDREVFAKWFQPYKDESLEPAVRGEGEATPEEDFYEFYWEGRYRQALAAFDKLEPESKTKGDLRFLKANCLLATGQAGEAIPLLENPGRTRFRPEAEWLLALAYLKNGQRDKAAAQFGAVAANESSSRREAARQILEEMK